MDSQPFDAPRVDLSFAVPKRRPLWPWLIGIFVLLFLLIAVVIIAAVVGGEGSDGIASPSGNYVAVLHIEGTIAAETDGVYGHEYVCSALRKITADPKNHGLVLYIDSPGGELYAIDEVYRLLLKYRETGRPVYAYSATYAASGGYYLAVAADAIWANRMGTLGSIGVTYGYHLDLSGLAEKLGIDVTAIASDENKSMGGYFSPLTEEQKAIFQSRLDEYYDVFVDVVDAGRPLSRAEILPLADGRTYTAKQALEVGLIDGIAAFDEFLAQVMAEARFSGCQTHDFSFVYEGLSAADLLDLLGRAGQETAVLTEQDFFALLGALSRLRGPLALFGMN